VRQVQQLTLTLLLAAASNQFTANYGGTTTSTLNFQSASHSVVYNVPGPGVGVTTANIVNTGKAPQTFTGDVTQSKSQPVWTLSNTDSSGGTTISMDGGSGVTATSITASSLGGLNFATTQSGASFVFSSSVGNLVTINGATRGLGLFDATVSGYTNQFLSATLDNSRTVTVPNPGADSTMVLTRGNVTFLNNGGIASMFIDARNGRFGIGTTTPSAPLHVKGGARFDTAIVDTLTVTNTGVSGAVPTAFSNFEQVVFTSNAVYGSATVSSVPFNIQKVGNRVSVFSPDTTGYTVVTSGINNFHLSSFMPARFAPLSLVPCFATYLYNIGATGTQNNACAFVRNDGSIYFYADSKANSFNLAASTTIGWNGIQLIADYFI